MSTFETAHILVPTDVSSRCKAAAWAWYQRSAGRITQGGRSEAFAARYASVRAPSRFRLEAEALLESEERRSSESSSTKKSFSSADGMNSMDLVSLDHGWDCGSSLFDSFELVTLSKRLDTGLTDPFIRPPRQSVSDLVSASALDALVSDLVLPTQFPKLPRLSMPVPRPTCRSAEIVTHAHEQDSFFDKFPSHSSGQENSDFEKYPIQELHDIFPYYGPSGNSGKGMGFGKHRRQGKCHCGDGTCGHVKKQKSKNRVSFHGLSKALQHIAHLAHSGDHHHHREHHYHHNHLQSQEPSQALQISLSSHLRGDYHDSKLQHHYHQYQHKHVHHHHHHHYHYLFHSEDGFRLQPLDKSLVVAAAGLRTPKISPFPSPIPFEIPRVDGVDYK